MRKIRFVAATVLAALVFAAQPAVAQQLSMSILNSGKPPADPIPVKVVEDGQERTVGTTDSDGNVVIDESALNLPAGTRVAVHVVECDDETKVVLGTAADDDCDDDVVGYFPLGSTSQVNIDTGTGAFSTGMAGGVGYGKSWRIGAGVDYFTLTNLDETGCVGATSCEVDDSGISPHVFIEYDLGFKVPVHLGLGASYKKFSVNQDFGGGDNSVVDVDAFSLDLYGGFRPRLSGRSWLYLDLGFSWLNNCGEVTSDIGGVTFREDRNNDGFRTRFGLGVDFGLSDQWGVRLGGNYTLGDENDADTGFDFGVSGMLFLGG